MLRKGKAGSGIGIRESGNGNRESKARHSSLTSPVAVESRRNDELFLLVSLSARECAAFPSPMLAAIVCHPIFEPSRACFSIHPTCVT